MLVCGKNKHFWHRHTAHTFLASAGYTLLLLLLYDDRDRQRTGWWCFLLGFKYADNNILQFQLIAATGNGGLKPIMPDKALLMTHFIAHFP